MNDKFDELARSMAQSVTRRGALKKFSLCLAVLALAALGLANKTAADPHCLRFGSLCGSDNHCKAQCCSGQYFNPCEGSGEGRKVDTCNTCW